MLHIRPMTLVSLECTGSRQRNHTSLVLAHCVVLDFLLLCWPSSRKHDEMHEYRTFLCAVRVLIAYSICQLYPLSMLYVDMQCTQTYWVSRMKKHGKQRLNALSIDIYIPLPQPCTHYCCVLITKSNAYCKKKITLCKKNLSQSIAYWVNTVYLVQTAQVSSFCAS